MELKTLSVRGLQPRHANTASQHISDSQHRFTASFLQPLPQREDARQPGLECEHSRLNIYRRALQVCWSFKELTLFVRDNNNDKKEFSACLTSVLGVAQENRKTSTEQKKKKKDRMLCRIVETGVRPTRKEDNYGLQHDESR